MVVQLQRPEHSTRMRIVAILFKLEWSMSKHKKNNGYITYQWLNITYHYIRNTKYLSPGNNGIIKRTHRHRYPYLFLLKFTTRWIECEGLLLQIYPQPPCSVHNMGLVLHVQLYACVWRHKAVHEELMPIICCRCACCKIMPWRC